MRARHFFAVCIFAGGLVGLNNAAFAADTGIVERLDPALDALLAPDVTLETVHAAEAHFFEGPVWQHGKEGQFLTFSDIPENRIDKWENGKVTPYLTDIFKGKDPDALTEFERGGHRFIMKGANGETLDRQGRLVFCSIGAGEIIRREPDGKLTLLADAYDGHHFNSPNDLVVKSDGAIYFTDVRANGINKDKTPPDGAPITGVYRLKDGKASLVVGDITNPNGIAFSPDEKYLYVNSSRMKLIKRYTMMPDGGVTGGEVLIDMSKDTRVGNPDGMKVDAKGNIWATAPGGLWIVTPEGKHIGTVHTPHLTNLAWGDADGKALYLTSAGAVTRLKTKIVGVRP